MTLKQLIFFIWEKGVQTTEGVAFKTPELAAAFVNTSTITDKEVGDVIRGFMNGKMTTESIEIQEKRWNNTIKSWFTIYETELQELHGSGRPKKARREVVVDWNFNEEIIPVITRSTVVDISVDSQPLASDWVPPTNEPADTEEYVVQN